MSILVSWALMALAFLLTSAVLPGMKIKSFKDAVVVAAIFGVLNFLFAKVLFMVLGVLTFGLGFVLFFLTWWVVNAILLKLTDKLSDSIELKSSGTAVAGALLVAVFNAAAQFLVKAIF